MTEIATERKNAILEVLDRMDEKDIIALFNTTCDDCEAWIYYMDEIDDVYSSGDGTPVWNALRAAYYGEFNPTDNFFTINSDGNLYSFDYLDENIDFDCLADVIDENDDAYGYPDIADVLREYPKEG